MLIARLCQTNLFDVQHNHMMYLYKPLDRQYKKITNTRKDKHCWVKLKILIWALTTLGKKGKLNERNWLQQLQETTCIKKRHRAQDKSQQYSKVIQILKKKNWGKSVRYLIIYSYLLNLLQFSSLIGQHHPVCICYHNSYHWQESN